MSDRILSAGDAKRIRAGLQLTGTAQQRKLLDSHEALRAERDALRFQKDALIAERDAWQRVAARLDAERDALKERLAAMPYETEEELAKQLAEAVRLLRRIADEDDPLEGIGSEMEVARAFLARLDGEA